MPKLLCQHPGCQNYPKKGGQFCRWHEDLFETMKDWRPPKVVPQIAVTDTYVVPADAEITIPTEPGEVCAVATLEPPVKKSWDGHDELEGCRSCIKYSTFPACCNGVQWRCADWDLMYHYQPV